MLKAALNQDGYPGLSTLRLCSRKPQRLSRWLSLNVVGELAFTRGPLGVCCVPRALIFWEGNEGAMLRRDSLYPEAPGTKLRPLVSGRDAMPQAGRRKGCLVSVPVGVERGRVVGSPGTPRSPGVLTAAPGLGGLHQWWAEEGMLLEGQGQPRAAPHGCSLAGLALLVQD